MAAPVLLDKQNNTNVIHHNNLHMACATVLGFLLHDACIGLVTHTYCNAEYPIKYLYMYNKLKENDTHN